MAISEVFINNRSQAVRLLAEVRLPEGVKHVSVRAIGNESSRLSKIPGTAFS